MKKLLSIILSATMLLGVVVCGSASNNADTSASTDKIIVGLDDQFPPMGFRDDKNELVGFELNTGKISLIWNGFTITDDRLASMEFTKPYLNNRQIIVVKDGSDIKSKADLVGKNVGVQKGSSAVDAINADEIHNQFASNPTYETNVLAFTDLETGRIDAVVADEIVAKYYTAQNPDKNLKVLDDDFGTENYGIAAKKGNTELIDKLQTALNELSADGTAAEISNKWFGEDIVVNNN